MFNSALSNRLLWITFLFSWNIFFIRVGDAYIASKVIGKNHPLGKWFVQSSRLFEEESEKSCEIKTSGKSTAGFVITTVVKNKDEENNKYKVRSKTYL